MVCRGLLGWEDVCSKGADAVGGLSALGWSLEDMMRVAKRKFVRNL